MADGPMVKYHGDKLREYILSLMKIVSQNKSSHQAVQIRDVQNLGFFQVSLIYRDRSLGNSIRMSVVKVLILEETETFAPKQDEASNHSNHAGRRIGSIDERISASDMLKAFCKWQGRISEYSPDDPQQYDVALLLTR